MHRSQFIVALWAMFFPPKLSAQSDPYKLDIQYELLVPGIYRQNPLRPEALPKVIPKSISFTAHRRDTALALTQHILPVLFSARFGNGFVTTLGFTNLGEAPGWNYFINQSLPPRPANQIIASVGDRIEWRLGKHPV